MKNYLLVFVLVQSVTAAAADKLSFERAATADPLGKKSWRPNIKGAFRTTMGVQFHSACLKLAEKGRGKKKAEAMSGLNHAVQLAYERIEACQAKYPELKPYLSEWITKFRRTVITCTPKTQTELGYGAAHHHDGFGVHGHNLGLWDEIGEEGRRNLDVDGGDFKSLARTNRPVIVFPSDTITEAASGQPSDWIIDTLIHESLHSTHANNTAEHNDIEQIGPSQNGQCGKDITHDRVNVISTLCSQGRLHRGKNPRVSDRTEIVMKERIDNCGMKACTGLFTSQTGGHVGGLFQSWDEYYAPSKPLSKADAESVCARIVDQGSCRIELKANGRTLTKDNVRLNGHAKRIEAKLEQIFPNDRIGLTSKLLRAFPGVSDQYAQAKATGCFKAVFDDTASGHALKTTPKLYRPSREPLSNGRTQLELIKTRIKSTPECAGDTKTATLIASLRTWVGAASGADSYDMYRDRLYGSVEGQSKIRGNRGGKEGAFGNLVGHETVRSYLADVAKLHFQSENFDCEEAGLIKTPDFNGAMASLNGGRSGCQ